MKIYYTKIESDCMHAKICINLTHSMMCVTNDECVDEFEID